MHQRICLNIFRYIYICKVSTVCCLRMMYICCKNGSTVLHTCLLRLWPEDLAWTSISNLVSLITPIICVLLFLHLANSFLSPCLLAFWPLTHQPLSHSSTQCICSTPSAAKPILHERAQNITAKKQYEKGKNKIIWRLHQFFMNFHLDQESPLTAIDRSSCCHAV